MPSSPLFDVGQNLLTHSAPPLDDGLILAALFPPAYPLCKILTGTPFYDLVAHPMGIGAHPWGVPAPLSRCDDQVAGTLVRTDMFFYTRHEEELLSTRPQYVHL